MRRVAAVLAIVLAVGGAQAGPAAAIECDKLRPVPPQTIDRTYNGKLNAAVDGWFAKLVKVGAGVEGTYHDVAANVLPQFPQADRLYVWERVVYLKYQVISEANDLSTQEKLAIIDSLNQQFAAPPAGVIDNSGNNAVIIQGNNNSVNKGN